MPMPCAPPHPRLHPLFSFLPYRLSGTFHAYLTAGFMRTLRHVPCVPYGCIGSHIMRHFHDIADPKPHGSPNPKPSLRATNRLCFAQRHTYASHNHTTTLRAMSHLCFVQRYGDGATIEVSRRDAMGLHSKNLEVVAAYRAETLLCAFITATVKIRQCACDSLC